MSEADEIGGGQGSFAVVPLDGAQLHRLLALRAATSELTPAYASVLTVLAEAKASYQLQLKTTEIADRLDLGVSDADSLTNEAVELRPVLDQLRGWGCIDWVQDPGFRAASIEEYLRRHELWELTPVGEATLAAIHLVLDATEQGGSLQRALFRQITEALDALEVSVPAGDATTVYLRLRDLDLAIADLANNARDFYATVNRLAREERLEDHVFLTYKDHLISYLQEFHEDLSRNRQVIAGTLARLDDRHRGNLLRLAAQGDDSTDIFGEEADWEQRWDGMQSWFLPIDGRRPDAEALANATTVAIRELLTLLRRLTEQASRPVTRSAELRSVAAWFARCESDAEAHELFDAAFGLTPPLHLGLELADVDASGKFPSWWEAEPVPVPLSLREYGRRPARGRTGRRRDYAAAKREIEAAVAAAEGERAQATNRLVTVDLGSTTLGDLEFPILLEMLDRVLAARPASDTFDTTIRSQDATIRLRSADHDTRILAAAGTLTVVGCKLEITETVLA